MISEETCAVRLGLTRVVLASMRREHLKEDTDWVKDGKKIVITKAGLARVTEILGLNGAEVPSLGVTNDPASQHSDNGGSTPPGAAAGFADYEAGRVVDLDRALEEVPPASINSVVGALSAPEPEPVTLVVTSKRPPRNSHIVEAKLGEQLVRVRVKDNANFLPGMEIRARQDEDYADMFVLVGRTPRYKGRW